MRKFTLAFVVLVGLFFEGCIGSAHAQGKKYSDYPTSLTLGPSDLILFATPGVTNKTITGTNLFQQINGMQLWTNISGAIYAQNQRVKIFANGSLEVSEPLERDDIQVEITGRRANENGVVSLIYMTGVTTDANTFFTQISSGTSQTNGLVYIVMGDDTRDLMVLDPTLGWGGESAYVLNTATPISSGNIAVLKNSGTNKFNITWDGNVAEAGSLIPSGNTNRISTAGGLLLLDGVAIPTFATVTNVYTWSLSDMTTALTTGTNRNFWIPKFACTVKYVRANVATVSSSGLPTFDILEGATSILSTLITIDANERSSDTAATPAVISDSAIAAGAYVNFSQTVAGTAAAGAQLEIGFTIP